MDWCKQGLIFKPSKSHSFAKNRVMLPTPLLINPSTIRIYCGFVDDTSISRLGYVDVKADNPSEIISTSQEPLLDSGLDGSFDDNGLCPSSVVRVGSKVYLYYFGFQLGVKVPFYIFSGLAISEDNGETFFKYSSVPILERSSQECFIRSGPCVIYDQERSIFRMWYLSTSELSSRGLRSSYYYDIYYLESDDGIVWGKVGMKTIARTKEEIAFGRPFYFKLGAEELLFYSKKTNEHDYRIGVAKIIGNHYSRVDSELDFDLSEEGWDSEMLCCSSIFQHNEKVYMFYNGNNIGETGFGYAILV